MISSWRHWSRISAEELETLAHRTVVIAAFSLGALVMSHNKADPDLWGHWQYGVDAIRFGLPDLATYTYTTPNHRWINHEWIHEWLLAAGWYAVGGSGLLAIKCLLGVALLTAFYTRARAAGMGRFPAASLMLAAAINLMLFWSLRPQVVSFLLLAGTLWLLDRAFGRTPEGKWSPETPIRYRYLVALPPVLALWANAHGGFAAGAAVIAVYLAGRAIQLAWNLGSAAWKDVAALLGLIAVTFAATLVNPYTWQLHKWMWQSLSQPRPEILEWLPPELFSAVWLPFWLFVLGTLVVAIATRRRIDLVEGMILAALLWQATRHHRHVALFVVAATWWMPHAWHEFGQSFRRSAEQDDALAPSWSLSAVILAVSIAASCFFAVVTVTRFRQIEVLPSSYPVQAFQFMADHELEGRLVVQFRWAQYAIVAFGNHDDARGQGQGTVAFDGRFRTCYPQWIVDLSFDFLLGHGPGIRRYRGADSPPFDPSQILHVGDPELVLIHVDAHAAHRVMMDNRDEWIVLYRDGVAELWGRRKKYGDPTQPTFLPPNARRFTDNVDSEPVAFPAVPSTSRPSFQKRRTTT